MSQELITLIDESPPPWLRTDRGGGVVERGTGQPPAGTARSVALVSMRHCLLLAAALPDLTGRRLKQALPYALEDQLAGPVESQHVVPLDRGEDGRVRALVVARQQMADWLERLQTRHTSPDKLLPDALCLPWTPGSVSLMALGGQVLLRWDTWAAASIEPELLAMMLSALVPVPEYAVCFGEPPPGLAETGWPLQRRPGGVDVLVPEARAQAINLLQDEFTSRTAGTRRRRWRWVAVLAGAALGLYLATVALETVQLNRRADTLDTRIQDHMTRTFPGLGRVIPGRERLQAEQALARLRFGEAAGFVDLLARTAPLLEGAPEIELRALDYRDGSLELSLRAPGVSDLDALEARLRSQGLDAAVQSATLGGDGADARLRVREPGA